jgi:hypothetical protein
MLTEMASSIVGFIRLESKNKEKTWDLPVAKQDTSYRLVSSATDPEQLELLINPEPQKLYKNLQHVIISILTTLLREPC